MYLQALAYYAVTQRKQCEKHPVIHQQVWQEEWMYESATYSEYSHNIFPPQTAVINVNVSLTLSFSDTDPRVLEKQEQQQPTYLALSYINR